MLDSPTLPQELVPFGVPSFGDASDPEDLFGAYYHIWKRYYGAYGRLLPSAVWAALLMRRGVIPLNQRKKPWVKWKPYQADPADIEQVLAWARLYHPSAWAVITGQRYHILVLDFDGARGIQTMQALGLQPHVRTGSGGYHAYIAYPDDLNVRTWNARKAPFLDAILPGTDIKANGGYAAFAGTSNKGAYQWLRPIWPDRCTPKIHDLMAQVISASQRNANGGSGGSTNPGSFSANGHHRVSPNVLLKWAWVRAIRN
jgi:hypothetical protein